MSTIKVPAYNMTESVSQCGHLNPPCIHLLWEALTITSMVHDAVLLLRALIPFLMLLLLKNNMEVSACKPRNQIPATDESHAQADSRFRKKRRYWLGKLPAAAETLQHYLTHMLLLANLANTNWYKNTEKSPKPWQTGFHLRVLGESFPMNTNMTGFRWFSQKISASYSFGWK